MILFLDTEFTGAGDDLQLLSLALVGDDNRTQFYCERNDVPRSDCTAYVLANVLPFFGAFPNRVGDWAWCRAELRAFLDTLEHAAAIACDLPQDLDLLMKLYGGWPEQLFKPRIHLEQITKPEFQEAVHAYHTAPGRPWHHAMWDARALLRGWQVLNGG